MIPKTAKLKAEEAASAGVDVREMEIPLKTAPRSDVTGKYKIKPIQCINDWVILIQLPQETNLALPADTMTDQGVVVGVGPGVAEGGTRVPSQLKIGDLVVFSTASIVKHIDAPNGAYAGKHLVLLSERAVYFKLMEVDWEEVDD